MHNIHQFSRYFPSEETSLKWGWRLLDAGTQTLPPHVPYPGAGHPQSYLFDKQGFRQLEEHQLVVLREGRGVFQSESHPEETAVAAGQAFLLFPGERHRYRPDPQTGWTETWIGFNGREADRIVESFFDRNQPVIQVARPEALHAHLDRLLEFLRSPVPPEDPVLAGHIPLALAWVGFPSQGADPDIVAKAKSRLLIQPEARTDLQALARELGVSYSKLRFAFREQTGFSLRAFENRMKLNRAKDLLRHEGLTVSETALALGYANVHYFSTAFKKQFGCSPVQWRKDFS